MMKKIRMNCTATLDETFADFLLSRRAKGLAEKTLESYSSQWKAVAQHLGTGTDVAALQKAALDAMIVSMRDAGLSPKSLKIIERSRIPIRIDVRRRNAASLRFKLCPEGQRNSSTAHTAVITPPITLTML